MSDSVCLAYVHSNEVAHSWHLSVMEMLSWDVAHNQRIIRGGFLGMRCGTGGLVSARNETVARFLAGDADWLFWVDTDMGFTPDTVDRLLDAADPVERPVMGALCFAQQEYELDGMGGHRTRPSPTLFQWVKVGEDRQGFTAWRDYPRNQVVRVAGTGAACIIIHRSVLLAVAERFGPGNWYSRMLNPSTGQLLSEDLSFCARVVQCGLPVHVDTSVKTSHLKPIWLSEEDYPHPENGSGERVALSVLIPYRPDGGHRDRLWRYLKQRWEATGYEVVECHDPVEDAPFSFARAINASIKEATGDAVAIFGADHLPDRWLLDDMAAQLAHHPWAMPYGRVSYATENTTEALLAGQIGDSELEWGASAEVCKGIWFLHRDILADLNGLDPLFEGWGWGDDAFNDVLATFHPGPRQGNATLRELWHPSGWRDLSDTNPNRARYETLYRPARGNPAAMREVLAGW